ncbi:uncharacterized protein Gasu_07400 [Galdieria sulphuraria]|uniref:TNase-like domain-containing protein n=1 Tax=Galdieria sulphuraria TaxID=130081 RepID=M2Y7G6_GALSU|nr:uncharacterized protein Gasu_07400 [Galdieria sulphuraria]EME31993.1 hypothetical protein Gasu_07400 [Galdieria sulphuraria]|eukprot:XP_005708513.1 hypothetical protein Gasu_07400 [Galdieria sulphuraria]
MNAFIVNWHWLSVAALTSASFGYLSATTKLLYMGVRRYKTAKDIPNSMFQRGSKIKGVVVSVGDGDNIRIFHRPFLFRFFGIGRHPVLKKRLSEETISVRLAGVDAPECAHFGAPGQEGGEQAKKWLRNYLKDRAVTVQLHSLDQYSRAVCTVHVRKGILRLKKNVSYELVKVGHAVVYRGFGAEYNGILRKLENAETEARKRKRGMWSVRNKPVISPQEYKRALKEGKGPESLTEKDFFSRKPESLFSFLFGSDKS